MSHDNIPNTPGIYAIRNIESGRIYIGSSATLRKRLRQHHSELLRKVHKNRKLQNSWSLHGEGCFEFFVIEYLEDKGECIPREQYWIDCADASNEDNYNILSVAGSALGQVRSEETRKKISEAGRGRKVSEESRALMSKAQKGKVVSEATKKLMSESRKGRKISEEQKRKLLECRLGSTVPEETRRRIAEGNRKTKGTPEYKAMARAKALGNPKYKGSKPVERTPEEQRLLNNLKAARYRAKKKAAKEAAKLGESV